MRIGSQVMIIVKICASAPCVETGRKKLGFYSAFNVLDKLKDNINNTRNYTESFHNSNSDPI